MTRLRMEMRAGERRPISEFELEEGETLESRVKREIAVAVERGDVPAMGMAATVPAIAIFEADSEADGPKGSIALFSANGTEVSYRDYQIRMGKDNSGRQVIQLTGINQPDGDDARRKEKVIGVFYEEDIARQIGSLWKAGILD